MTRLAALNRFGLGARIGELDRLGDPQGWLLNQLEGAPPLRALPPGTGPRDIADAIRAYVRASQARDQDARGEARRSIVQMGIREGTSTISQRATSDRPFVERLIAFWSDHLCVSPLGKFTIVALAGGYERDVIRGRVFGHFSEMVLASARHPAMLQYLDNNQSIGPRSAVVQRAQRARNRGRGGAGVAAVTQRGLNENYARELLELHTLGVDGGYSQADVTELARLLTGWSFEGANGSTVATFRYNASRAEPGNKTILGQRYREGEAEGVRAIRALCAHPSTARFLATKLARHFVSDDPPPALVNALAKSYADTDGDLREMARVLVTHPDSWKPEARKFRTPQDWIVAVLRATDARTPGVAPLDVLRQLRQPLWSPNSPKGFGDLEREWADPDSLLNRAELARNITRRAGQTLQPRAVERLATLVPDDAQLQSMVADARIPLAERGALVLAGPSFQWR